VLCIKINILIERRASFSGKGILRSEHERRASFSGSGVPGEQADREEKPMKKLLVVAVFLLIACTGSVWAQTPDGETPAEETDCDGLPGPLFGLCNAYCEAMDCDTGPNASTRACERVLANYHRHSGGEDPPCIQSGSCCEPHGSPGCDDAFCEEQVCGFPGFDFCCTVGWNDQCVEAANALCEVCGGGGPPPG
jgi:hypothetical protein